MMYIGLDFPFFGTEGAWFWGVFLVCGFGELMVYLLIASSREKELKNELFGLV